MRFFDNGAINRIYLHSALHGLSEYSGGAFVFVFLLKAGIELPVVLLTLAALVLLRLVFRQMVMPFAQRFGIRTTLIVGIGIGALSYIPIGYVNEPGLMLILFLILAALGDAFYWACFHATSARLGDEEMRGAQVSAVQFINALATIVGPLLGGLLQVWAGAVLAFTFAALVKILSALPLLATPNNYPQVDQTIDKKSNRFAAQVYFFDGFGNALAGSTWMLALFITLGESYQAYGLALGGAAIVGAMMGIGTGRMFDLGHHKWSTAIGMTAAASFVVAASLGYHTPITALAALSLGAVTAPLYMSAFNARVYNLSKASGDALRFQIWGEGGWDLGSALGCCIAALLVWQGFSFTWPIAMGLIGPAGVWFTLHQSYLKGEPSLRE